LSLYFFFDCLDGYIRIGYCTTFLFIGGVWVFASHVKVFIGIVYGFTKLNVVDFSGIVTEMFQHASISGIFRYHIELLEDSSKLVNSNF